LVLFEFLVPEVGNMKSKSGKIKVLFVSVSYWSFFYYAPQRLAAMLRAAFVPLCLLISTMLKVTISCLDDPNARHAI